MARVRTVPFLSLGDRHNSTHQNSAGLCIKQLTLHVSIKMKISHSHLTEQESSSTQASDRLRVHRSVYDQLPLHKSQTRVLRLHSQSSNATIVSCTLEVITLELEPSMVYTALSYVWGDASVTEDIIVNGVSFAVTTNLASALKQIRKVFGEVLLWADAICTRLGDMD